MFLREHRLQTLPCNRLWHKQSPIEYPLHLTSILSPLKAEYIERVQIFASHPRPPKNQNLRRQTAIFLLAIIKSS